MTSTPQREPGLKREIGQIGFGSIALNGTIGAGIFALPGIAIAKAGLFSPWMFLACGLLIMLIVLSFARAASYFDDTGGPVRYVTAAFGPFAGFQVGWLLTLSRAAAFAANAHLMVTYAGWFWAPLTDGFAHMTAVLAVCGVLGVLNVIGVRQGLIAMFALTLLKLLPLFLLVFLGISQVNPEIFTAATIPPLDSLGETALILFYAFVGFESALIPAGEARNARRDIPLALVRTILAITVFYFLIQVVALSVAPEVAESSTPLADVALVLMGAAGATLLTAGAIFSISGNLTASVLSAPRLLFALGGDGSLPRWLARVHPEFRTPANAIITYVVFTALLALSGGFVWLAVMSTAVRLLVYALCILSLPSLHRKFGERENQFRLPGGMIIPVLALLLSIWLMSHASLQSWLATGAFSLLGALLYVLQTRRRPLPVKP